MEIGCFGRHQKPNEPSLKYSQNLSPTSCRKNKKEANQPHRQDGCRAFRRLQLRLSNAEVDGSGSFKKKKNSPQKGQNATKEESRMKISKRHLEKILVPDKGSEVPRTDANTWRISARIRSRRGIFTNSPRAAVVVLLVIGGWVGKMPFATPHWFPTFVTPVASGVETVTQQPHTQHTHRSSSPLSLSPGRCDRVRKFPFY